MIIIKYNWDQIVKINSIQDKYKEKEMLLNKLKIDYLNKIILKLSNINLRKLISYICKLWNEFNQIK